MLRSGEYPELSRSGYLNEKLEKLSFYLGIVNLNPTYHFSYLSSLLVGELGLRTQGAVPFAFASSASPEISKVESNTATVEVLA